MLVDPKIHRLTSSSNQNRVEITETKATTPTITATPVTQSAAATKNPIPKKIRIKQKNIVNSSSI
jgi:hypothetical protein